MYGINLSNDIISYVLRNGYGGASFGWSWSGIISIPGNPIVYGGLDNVISTLVNIVVLFKLVGLYLRLIERIVLSGFLVIGSPLAFAAGVAQPTKGFFQGFIKVYVGNLVIMVLQNLGVAILLTYITQPPIQGIGTILSAFIALAITKVIAKLEDIVRDMSVGVGVGRDMGGALQNVQGMAYSGGMIINTVKSFKG